MSARVQCRKCAGCRVLVREGRWYFMNLNVWILVLWIFISVVLHGLLAHISMIVFWRVEASFPSPSSCSHLVALHFPFGRTASFSVYFNLAAKIHQRIFNLCAPSSLQPLSEAQRASTLRLAVRKGKKNCVFKQRRSYRRTALPACQHHCSIQTPAVRNIFCAHICEQM